MLRTNLASYCISCAIIFAILSKTESSSISQCLSCWNHLCSNENVDSSNCPQSCYTFTGKLIGELGAVENQECCSYAEQYVSSIENNNAFVSFDESQECPKSGIYNDVPENFDSANYEDKFAYGEQYFLFSEVKFGCSGCVSNVSIYSSFAVNQDIDTAFQIWTTIKNDASNQTALNLTQEFKLTLTSGDSIQWNGYYQTTKTLNSSALCFNAGDVFGITMANDIDVFTAEASSGITYKTEEQGNCEILRRLYFVQGIETASLPLIAVGIIELSSQPSSTIAASTKPSETMALTSGHSSSSASISTTTTKALITEPSSRKSSSMLQQSMTIPPTLTSTSVSPLAQPTVTMGSLIDSAQPTVSTGSLIDSNLAVAVVIAIVVVIVVLLIVVAVIIGICVYFNKRDPKDVLQGIEMLGHTGRSSSDALDFQIATRISPDMTTNTSQFSSLTPPPHLPPPRSRDASKELLQTNYYDDPTNFLDRQQVAFQGMPMGNGQLHHYESMDTGIMMDNHTPLNASRSTVSDITYSRPQRHNPNNERIVIQNRYDVPPPRTTSSNSDYDHPTALETQRGTLDPYQEHEDFFPPQDNSIENGRKYFIIDKDSVSRRGSEIKTHVYHVMEPGHHVPSAEERNQVEPAMNTVGSLPQQFFEETPQYWEPAEKTECIYDQLNEKKCRELKREEIELTEEIGSGQFGTVWCGEWLLRGGGSKRVAVKALRSNASEEERARFLREGARMMQFFHSNVVQLYGVVTLGEPILLVLELMKEGDLLKFLEDSRPDNGRRPIPTPSQLLKFCRDIAIGMRHLAKKKFVHRDLAARNILLNEKLICKIGDFGMTRSTSHKFDPSKPMCVPLRWTAPEAIRSRNYSEKSDVYSYGMVMYEIWSLGRRPFPKEERIEIIKSFIDQGRIMAPPPGCPREIYRLMAQCWHPSPTERPTFSDVYNDFLDTDDETLLNWSSEDLGPSMKASEIGADLMYGYELYKELQYQYRTPENQ